MDQITPYGDKDLIGTYSSSTHLSYICIFFGHRPHGSLSTLRSLRTSVHEISKTFDLLQSPLKQIPKISTTGYITNALAAPWQTTNTPHLLANISGRIIRPLFLAFDVSFLTDPRPQSCTFFWVNNQLYIHKYCSTLESLRVVLRLLSSSSACSTVVLKSSFKTLFSLLILNMPISFLVSSKVATYLRETLLSSKATRGICIFKFVMTSH